MKYLLILLACLLFPCPVLTGESTERQWFCRQNGQLGDRPAMVITQVWSDPYPNHYEEREKAFERHIKRTQKEFIPSFQAKCREYYEPKHANKHRGRELKAADKYSATVIPINWRWTPDVREGRDDS